MTESIPDIMPSPIPENHLQAALEAILFAAGDPISIDRLAEITGYNKKDLEPVLAYMQDRYHRQEQGIHLRKLENTYVLCTKPEMKLYLERVFAPRQRTPLSQAAYETLSVIAYNQPVTRAQIEAVRGVNSDSLVSRLLERGWIRECGTLEGPGHPALFETTKQFLMEFGISSVMELPALELMMYSTIRDLETSLSSAASGNSSDDRETNPEDSAPRREEELVPGSQQSLFRLVDESFMGKD